MRANARRIALAAVLAAALACRSGRDGPTPIDAVSPAPDVAAAVFAEAVPPPDPVPEAGAVGSAGDAETDTDADVADADGEREAADAADDHASDVEPDGVPEAADAGERPAIPEENRRRGERPPIESAEAGARRLLEAIRADDPSLAAGFVFPAPAFDVLKDMPGALDYHRRLVRWYEEDVSLEHERYPDVENLVFEAFRFGRCSWQDVGSEGNRVAYWSCRRNRLVARAGERVREFEIRVLINWGSDWFITHLRPVRR